MAGNISAKWEELRISNDFIFGKVMQDPGLCKKLLQRILPDLNIDHVEYPEAQKSIRADADAKSVRLDVYVQDGKGTVYDIEMQVSNAEGLPQRARYYQGMIDLQLIDRGAFYTELKPSYVIFICPFDLFGKGRHIYTFENICREDRGIFLSDGTAKIFLNAQGSMDDVSDELKAFLDYVAGKKPDDSFVQELEAAVKEARKNREWRHEYMTLLMREQECEQRGLKQGLEQGLEQGIKQGMKEGLEQGILGMVSTLNYLSVPEEVILQELEKKFHLSRSEAESYMEKR